jgi:Protein of unknown function (DUF2911)
MTKIRPLLIGIVTAAVITLVTSASMAHGAERESAKVTIKGAHISIDYGRPLLKGRDMLKQIEPGQVWRIGADAPTTLESDKDLNFGGITVPKGKHILLAHLVEPGKWTLVFSKKSAFEYDESAKLAEVPLTFQEAGDSVEMVTIKLTDNGGTGVLEIAWGKLRLSTSFKPA